MRRATRLILVSGGTARLRASQLGASRLIHGADYPVVPQVQRYVPNPAAHHALYVARTVPCNLAPYKRRRLPYGAPDAAPMPYPLALSAL